MQRALQSDRQDTNARLQMGKEVKAQEQLALCSSRTACTV